MWEATNIVKITSTGIIVWFSCEYPALLLGIKSLPAPIQGLSFVLEERNKINTGNYLWLYAAYTVDKENLVKTNKNVG